MTAGEGLTAEKRQEERKVAWIFKPGFALLIGSPGINIKLIQYVDLEIALIQQHWLPPSTHALPDKRENVL